MGILSWIVLGAIIVGHVAINVGMNVGLFPITGLPLPFLSYGGSFLVAMFVTLASVFVGAFLKEVPLRRAYDFEGDARIIDGDSDGDPIVDMGVDEARTHVYLPLVCKRWRSFDPKP